MPNAVPCPAAARGAAVRLVKNEEFGETRNSLASVSYQGRGGVPMGTVHKGPCNATQRRPRRSIPTRHCIGKITCSRHGGAAFGLRCTRELCVLRSCEDPRPGSARAQSRSRRRRARTSESLRSGNLMPRLASPHHTLRGRHRAISTCENTSIASHPAAASLRCLPRRTFIALGISGQKRACLP